MRKTFFVFITLLFVFGWVKYVAAVPPDAPVVTQIGDRIEELQDKIDDGKETGELTRSEAKRLQSRLDRIKRHFDRAKRGFMPLPIVDELNNKLDTLEDDISKQKHDSQKAK